MSHAALELCHQRTLGGFVEQQFRTAQQLVASAVLVVAEQAHETVWPFARGRLAACGGLQPMPARSAHRVAYATVGIVGALEKGTVGFDERFKQRQRGSGILRQ